MAVGIIISSLHTLLLQESASRQWPEVYDLCHTFLHVARVKHLRESNAFRV